MEFLASFILSRLEKHPYCVVPESRLRRAWPGEPIEGKLHNFTLERDLRLMHYAKGWGAMIVRRVKGN